MTNREDGLCMIVCNMFQTLKAEKEVLFQPQKAFRAVRILTCCS